MKIFAGIHCHNADRWIGFAIASVINSVDKVVVGVSRQTNDNTNYIIKELQKVTDKIIVYDNDRCDLVPGGFGAVKTELINKCREIGADWVLSFDHDHIYYPLNSKLYEVAQWAEQNGFEGVKFRQYFIYNGLRTLPLNLEINPKTKNPGYSMFASFFKLTPSTRCEKEVHENVIINTRWAFRPDIDFAHIGPVMSDWEVVQKELFYAKLNKKIESENDYVEWLKKCQEINFFPKCMLDFTARRREEFKFGLPDITEVKPEGLPPVLDCYVNGSHKLDLEWLKKFIKEGR